MITFDWCNKCDAWSQFFKKGRNPRETTPWECEKCGWETKTFPKYENPITWVITGRRPK